MSVKKAVEIAVKENSDKVRFDTDTLYYNESYKEVILIGAKLKSGISTTSDVINLCGTLLAWNQGAKHAGKMSSLIYQFESYSNNEFKELIRILVDIESKRKGIENFKDEISNILRLSQSSLKMDSVVMPSKLIHFISPSFFAMTDSNVNNAIIGESINTCSGYVEYVQALWSLGFHLDMPVDDKLYPYWSNNKITPMRALDCTLYAKGKTI